jgi:hypothetical protein
MGEAYPIFIGLIVAAVFVFIYKLLKTMVLGLYNGGDNPVAMLAVKRSVIEGVKIDFDSFEKAATLLNKVVCEFHVKNVP